MRQVGGVTCQYQPDSGSVKRVSASSLWMAGEPSRHHLDIGEEPIEDCPQPGVEIALECGLKKTGEQDAGADEKDDGDDGGGER